jgi:hypothetical protein
MLVLPPELRDDAVLFQQMAVSGTVPSRNRQIGMLLLLLELPENAALL